MPMITDKTNEKCFSNEKKNIKKRTKKIFYINENVPATARKVLNFFQLDRSYTPLYSLDFGVVAVSICFDLKYVVMFNNVLILS